MENTSQIRLTEGEGSLQRGAEQAAPCAYVVVIPRIEGPVLETIEKLIAALSSQCPVVLPTASRRPELEIVDSWLEHTAAAEYLGVGRSTLYRSEEHTSELQSRFGISYAV